MKKVIRLTESDLNKIVKKIMAEQVEPPSIQVLKMAGYEVIEPSGNIKKMFDMKKSEGYKKVLENPKTKGVIFTDGKEKNLVVVDDKQNKLINKQNFNLLDLQHKLGFTD
jgi:hypothetical protein